MMTCALICNIFPFEWLLNNEQPTQHVLHKDLDSALLSLRRKESRFHSGFYVSGEHVTIMTTIVWGHYDYTQIHLYRQISARFQVYIMFYNESYDKVLHNYSCITVGTLVRSVKYNLTCNDEIYGRRRSQAPAMRQLSTKFLQGVLLEVFKGNSGSIALLQGFC